MSNTMRRLSDDDVRAIFESLHGSGLPPPHLKFAIVPVGANGLKLSPPSFEFEDGLYVLLRPEKRRKHHGSAAEALQASGNSFGSKAPEHLSHLLMTDCPPETCPWSLSGPQFPQPTAIQQRYCYPKGDPEYAGRKGGALWTMYGRDGKEDFEFRLLHVYFSAKRAVNKGVTLSCEDRAKQQFQDQLAASQVSRGTPKRKAKRVSRAERSPWQRPGHQPLTGKASSTDLGWPDREAKRARLGYTPQAFPYCGALVPPPSPFQRTHRPEGLQDSSIYVSPNTAASSVNSDHGCIAGGNSFDHSMFDHPPFHPVPSFDANDSGKTEKQESTHDQFPFRGTGRGSLDKFCRTIHRPTVEKGDSFEFNEAAVTMIGGSSDASWNDPLLILTTKASFESATKETDPANKPISSGESLKARLGSVHERIREGILAHPAAQQGHLLSIVASWARSVAENPLVPTIQRSVERDTVEQPPEDSKTPSVRSMAI